VDYDGDPEAGKPFSFHAVVEVMPKAQLGEYMGLQVPHEESTVEDEEVDGQVDRLRREFAELRAVAGRPAREEDYVTVDFSGLLDGEPVDNTTVEDYQYQLGSGQFLPDLEKGIVGMSVGEERVVPVTFPEDYGSEELAGKTLDFTVRLKDLKEMVLPDLNDDFAKDVSEFATLLELRLDIRQKLQGVRDSDSRRRFRNAALAMATDHAGIELPESVVEEQAHEMVEDFVRSLSVQGADLKQYMEATGTTLESMLTDVRPGAETTVKTGAVLDAVAEAEGLEVTDEELEERLSAMAAQAGMDPAEYRSRLSESGRMTTVRRQLVREKAADLIVESAVATAPEPASAPAEEEGMPDAAAAGDGDEGHQAGGGPASEAESAPAEA
jgi:trigger factor